MSWWTKAQWARAQELTKPFCPKVLGPSSGRCCRVVTAFGDPHPSRILGVTPLGTRAAPRGLSSCSCSSRSIQGTPLPLLVLTRLSSRSPPWDFGIQTVARACWGISQAGLCLMGTGQQREPWESANSTASSEKIPQIPVSFFLHGFPLPIFSSQALGWMLWRGWALPG